MLAKLVPLDDFRQINKKEKSLTTSQQRELAGYLSKVAKPLQSSDIIAGTNLGKIFTPKQLTFMIKANPEVERRDGSIEIIETLKENNPLLFVLKRNVCDRNCESCEENDRCIESDWEEESLKTNSLLL